MKTVMYLIKPFAPDPRVLKEARSLARAGHDVTVLALDHHREYPRESSLDSVRVKHVRGLKWRSRARPLKVLILGVNVLWFTLVAVAHTLAAGYRVYHCHDLNTLHIGVVVRMLRGGRLVYDSHECYPFLLAGLWGPLGRVGAAVERAMGCFVDLVVTANRQIREHLSFLGAPAIELRNLVDLEWFDSLVTRKSVVPEGTERPVLLYQGIVKARRGVEELIRVRERLATRATVVVAGDGPDLPRLSERYGGQPDVVFLGLVAYEDIPALVSAADVGTILFLPHFQNVHVSPNKIYEYMAAGIPIVVSDIPEMNETVADAGCGLTVDPTDRDSVARAFERLLADPEEARRLGRAGRAYVEEKVNWRLEVGSLVDAYTRFERCPVP